jgi:hypothetical protein
MIEKPTVVILGAGASTPYGFPTGPTLKNLICHPGTINSLSEMAPDLGFTQPELDQLIDRLKKGSASSIDAFLEKRPHLIRVGKCAIARSLIEFEHESKLLSPEAPANDWYAFFSALLLSKGPDRLAENNLTIVTFNYDRSFEYRLSLMISADFECTLEQATKYLEQLRLIHCHGTLGSLDKSHKNFRAYSPDCTATTIKTAAESIQIIHEADSNADTFKRAVAALGSAERVYFLGFGYHPINMARLGVRGPGLYPWTSTAKLFVNNFDSYDRQVAWLRGTYGFNPQELHPHSYQPVEVAVTRYLDF